MSEVNYSGQHLLADVWGAHGLTDLGLLEAVLTNAALASGATILGAKFHVFPGGGITGVVTLAESHISIHTWPEKNFMALDIFMCGDCDPRKAYDVIKTELNPEREVMAVMKRGVE